MKALLDKNLKLWPALIGSKCPRCRVGNIYQSGPYSMFGAGINKHCAHCGFIYEKEPGYFYGAMYVSFGLAVGELITIAVAISILTGSSEPWYYIIPMLTIVLSVAPLNYRYSKVLLLYFLTPGVRYLPDLSRDREKTGTDL